MDLYTACYKSKSRASKFKQMCDPTGNVKTRFLCQKYNNFAPLTCLPYLLSNEKTYRYINIHHIAVDIDGLAGPRPCRHRSDPLRHPTCRDNRQYIGLRQDHHRRNSTGIDVCHIVGRMHIALPPQKHRTRQPARHSDTHHRNIPGRRHASRRRHCRHCFRRERSHSHTLRADRSDRTAPQNNRLRTRPLRQSSENLRQPAGAHQRIAPHRRPRKRKLPPAQQPDRNFQQLFDTAFLCTYPRFVDRLNSLLLPEKTFPHPTPGQLTPELRVAAFMRIGVDDCNRIARTLGLSLNTVYTYRNRTRQRAADRNSFMADLMKIS